MRRILVAVVAVLALVAAVGCSSDDDGDGAAPADDASSTTDESVGSTDGSDVPLTEAARLVEALGGDELEQILVASGLEVDMDEVQGCFARGMLDEPELLEVDFDALEPTDPEGRVLMGIFFDCLPDGALVEMMVASVEQADAPPDAVACVREELGAIPSEELMELFLAAAADDTAALEEALGACVPA